MKKFNLALAVLASFAMFCVGCACATLNPGTQERQAMSQDATSAYNSVCASYNFQSCPQSVNTTFEQAYFGTPNHFSTDFPAMLAAVAGIMGTSVPPFTSSGKLNYDIEHWPDS